jgi:hypothetical protein
VLVPRLRAHHTRLAFLLRMWHISASALYDDASFARPPTARLTQNAPPISLWLLSRVPPSLNSSFWFEHSARLRHLRCGALWSEGWQSIQTPKQKPIMAMIVRFHNAEQTQLWSSISEISPCLQNNAKTSVSQHTSSSRLIA